MVMDTRKSEANWSEILPHLAFPRAVSSRYDGSAIRICLWLCVTLLVLVQFEFSAPVLVDTKPQQPQLGACISPRHKKD